MLKWSFATVRKQDVTYPPCGTTAGINKGFEGYKLR